MSSPMPLKELRSSYPQPSSFVVFLSQRFHTVHLSIVEEVVYEQQGSDKEEKHRSI